MKQKIQRAHCGRDPGVLGKHMSATGLAAMVAHVDNDEQRRCPPQLFREQRVPADAYHYHYVTIVMS